MNKDQAQRIIKDTFENKFEKNRFTRFIVELLNLKSSAVNEAAVTFNENQVPNAYQPFINSFEKIADYRSGEHKLDVLAIWLKKETSIERARTMQRNFVAWYLRGDYGGEMKEAVLAAFVSPDEKDWRFSLVKMDYSLGEDKKGRVKISEEFTPAKRWSFLVGSNENSHTAQSQLIDILAKDEINPTLTQLEESFNIEIVTKEFFKKYKELFFWTKETLDEIFAKDGKIRSDFEAKNINTIDFSKKLLGQIVFLYFLQKKGWFGVARDADWGTGPKNFLRELFGGKHGKYKNFYNDILELLFYDALRNDRSHNDDYYSNFNCKIPFLNGGLFDPINNYDWVHTDINLPDDLFSNEIITKEGDKGTGILDIFDRYNFTVKEDEPLEKEVAVDPEMLGKVFENLLEVKDRKSKGTYYTPREIVHYMCQQSLINYLATEMEEKVSKDDIEKLIKYGEQFGENNTDLIDSLKDIPESIIQNAKLIDERLADIKVCDPAVGSGAFLVGMMGEIVRTRNVLTNYLKESNRTIYSFKRDCIENSLYGVDIDSGAVEIAKLRLWLSLVVEEEDIKQIKPLPNLDYKIVCGNSLMSIEKNLFNQELFSELESLKKIFFDEINPNKKKEYKDKIDNLINQITDGNKEFDFEIYFSEVFHEKKGFDIVIANPPYNELRDLDLKKQKEYKKSLYYKYANRGRINIYQFFYPLALTISNKSSIISLITQNSILAEDSALSNREFIINNSKIIRFVSFPERDNPKKRVFENAKMSVCIGLLNKIEMLPLDYYFEINVWYDRYFRKGHTLKLSLSEIKRIFSTGIVFPISTDAAFKILKKIKQQKNVFYLNSRSGEIDVTKFKNKFNLVQNGYRVLTGAQVLKYRITDKPSQGQVLYLDINVSKLPPDKIKDIENERIVMQRITGVDSKVRLIVTMIPGDILCANSTNYITNNYKINLKCILGILNSTLINYFFKQTSTNTNITTSEINRIPIPEMSIKKQNLIVSFVDDILSIIKENDYQKNLKKQKIVYNYGKQIDRVVYNIYDLSLKEIEIVEKSINE